MVCRLRRGASALRCVAISGGVLTVGPTGAALHETESFVLPPHVRFAVQCRPRLVVDGRVNIRSDDGRRAYCTALCIRESGARLDLFVPAHRPSLRDGWSDAVRARARASASRLRERAQPGWRAFDGRRLAPEPNRGSGVATPRPRSPGSPRHPRRHRRSTARGSTAGSMTTLPPSAAGRCRVRRCSVGRAGDRLHRAGLAVLTLGLGLVRCGDDEGGAPCSTSADCAAEMVCLDGHCRARVYAGPAPLDSGDLDSGLDVEVPPPPFDSGLPDPDSSAFPIPTRVPTRARCLRMR